MVEKVVRGAFPPRGRAGGGGFYEYPAGGKEHLWEGLCSTRKADADLPQDMKGRILSPGTGIRTFMSRRGCAGIVTRRRCRVNSGYQFTGQGMVLQYINQIGLEPFVARSRELRGALRQPVQSPRLPLVRMAETGEAFA